MIKWFITCIMQVLLVVNVCAGSDEKKLKPLDKITLWKSILNNDSYRNMLQKHKGKISMKNAEFGKNVSISDRSDECYVLYSDDDLIYYLLFLRNKKGDISAISNIVAYPKTLDKSKILNLPTKGAPVYYYTGKPYFSLSEERKKNLNKEDEIYINSLLEVLNENFHAAYSLPFSASFLDNKYIDKTDFIGKYFLIPGLISCPENMENISEVKKEMYELFGFFSYDFPRERKKIEPPIPSWAEAQSSIYVSIYNIEGRQVAYINRVDKSLCRPYMDKKVKKEENKSERKQYVYNRMKTQISNLERRAKRDILKRQLDGLNKILEQNELDSWDDIEKAGLNAKQKAILEIDQSARKILNKTINFGYLMQREKRWFFIGLSKTLESPNLYKFDDEEDD